MAAPVSRMFLCFCTAIKCSMFFDAIKTKKIKIAIFSISFCEPYYDIFYYYCPFLFLLCSSTFQTGLFSLNLILTNCFPQNLVVTDTICQTPLDPSTINSADAQFHHTLIGLICYGAVFISRASPVFVWTFCAALIGFIDLPSERSGSQSSPSAQITERLRPSHWYFTNFRAPL